MPKAEFIPQSKLPTSTARTQSRVQWLMGLKPLEDALFNVIKHLQDSPDSVESTPVMLSSLSATAIDELLELKSPGSSSNEVRSQSLRQLKQELGMYVPIRLVQLCGDTEVSTLRDGRSASPRKILEKHPNNLGASNYTPHRVSPEGLKRLLAYKTVESTHSHGLRGRVGFHGYYETINREERNLAAIFYSLLAQPKNLRAFLDQMDASFVKESCRNERFNDEHAIFFEFAMLRDLWSTQVSGHSDLAREMILEYLPKAPSWLRTCTIHEFNSYWGAVNPSKTTIQMPANWSLPRMDAIEDHELFLSACLFKWSFNAKPDLVIRLSTNEAICVELKLESGIGVYPSTKADREVFKARSLKAIKQTEVQQFLMEDLLGFSTHFILISNSTTAQLERYQALSWTEVFSALDLMNLPMHMRRTIRSFLPSK